MPKAHKRNIHITNASGDLTIFSEKRLRKSLKKSGADNKTINEIIEQINPFLYEGISSKKIHRKAFELLRKKSSHSAARYKLKQALIELGPSGRPFERVVGELLQREGYETEVDRVIQGRCIPHEIDVIAQNKDIRFMVECKFHNRSGYKSDVKVPLYIYSRFKDIEMDYRDPNHPIPQFDEAWIYTNTRFTDEGIRFSNCVGLKLCSWDYPDGYALKDKMDLYHIYPVTCLTDLSITEKKQLIDQNFVLCLDIHDRSSSLKHVGIEEKRRIKILSEIEHLLDECNHE